MPCPPPDEKIVRQLYDFVKNGQTVSEAARGMGLRYKNAWNWLQYGYEKLGLERLNLQDPRRRNNKPDGLDDGATATPATHGMIEREVEDGIVVVASDFHYWPDVASIAHDALCAQLNQFRKDRDLRLFVANGDICDFPRISRHPPPGWYKTPEVQDELEECQDRLAELEKAKGKVEGLWPWGNHDQRLDIYLASRAPEIAGLRGTRLRDHFPNWTPCDGVFLNNRPGGAVVKHRARGGIHATWGNVQNAGRTIVTGHNHNQNVKPFTTYNGTLYGVDVGMIAPVWGPQFHYLEGGVRNWRQGWAVLTFCKGALLPPELATVVGDAVIFRGKQIG